MARSDCGSPSCRRPHWSFLWTIIVLEAPRPPPLAPLDLRLIESRRCGSPADRGSASQVRTDAQTRIWPLGRAWFRWHKCRRCLGADSFQRSTEREAVVCGNASGEASGDAEKAAWSGAAARLWLGAMLLCYIILSSNTILHLAPSARWIKGGNAQAGSSK